MRITTQHRTENQNRIRAAMDRLLRGEIPPGGNCDIKTLVREAGVDGTAFYGNRPYAHLREEFEARLHILQQQGTVPDPRLAQITRLKAENTALRQRLTERDEKIAELAAFKTDAMSRLAAQHDEITRLRTTVPGSSQREAPTDAHHPNRPVLSPDPEHDRAYGNASKGSTANEPRPNGHARAGLGPRDP